LGEFGQHLVAQVPFLVAAGRRSGQLNFERFEGTTEPKQEKGSHILRPHDLGPKESEVRLGAKELFPSGPDPSEEGPTGGSYRVDGTSAYHLGADEAGLGENPQPGIDRTWPRTPGTLGALCDPFGNEIPVDRTLLLHERQGEEAHKASPKMILRAGWGGHRRRESS
jgi:hypothetical protein